MPYACKLCVARNGLKGSEVDSLPQTEAELYEHLRTVHGVDVESHADNVAIDSTGQPLPMSSDDVWQHVLAMSSDPDCDIVVCILRNNKTGEIFVPVFGAPDPMIGPILEAAWRGYDGALRAGKGARH